MYVVASVGNAGVIPVSQEIVRAVRSKRIPGDYFVQQSAPDVWHTVRLVLNPLAWLPRQVNDVLNLNRKGRVLENIADFGLSDELCGHSFVVPARRKKLLFCRVGKRQMPNIVQQCSHSDDSLPVRLPLDGISELILNAISDRAPEYFL